MTASLYVTEAPNDRDLAKALGSMALRCPLAHGDVLFFGVSDTGDEIRILVERKKLGDMSNSILTGRYLYQAQCAKEAGIDVLVLVLETGDMRCGPESGLVEIPVWSRCITVGSLVPRLRKSWQPVKPEISYSRFDQYLTELDWLAGIIVKRSKDVKETAAIIKALWANFQKPARLHQSLHTVYSAPMDRADLLGRPGLVVRVAKEFSGVGWTRAREVAKQFHFLSEMVSASEEDWASIPGIGPKIAKSVVRQIHGQDGT